MPIKTCINEQLHIAEVRLNRPEKMNSLTFEMITLLGEALDALEKNDEVRVVILTGEGRAFCTGSDLNDRLNRKLAGTVLGGDPYITAVRRCFSKIDNFAKPVIAAMNGHAVGGGLELALACDIRIASDKAKLGLTEVKVGAIAGAGGTQRLPRLIGMGPAMEIILSGELIEAAEALRIGLVGKVVAPEEVSAAAWSLAEKIAKKAPLAVMAAKIAVKKGADMSLENSLDLESHYSQLLGVTADRAEGMNAFLEKRDPIFVGK